MRVTFLPSTIRVSSSSAPHPAVQNVTATAMSGTGTLRRVEKRCSPDSTRGRTRLTNLVLFSSLAMSNSSCALSPKRYGSSGVTLSSLATSSCRACLSAIEPVGTMVYAARAGRLGVATSSAEVSVCRNARRCRPCLGGGGTSILVPPRGQAVQEIAEEDSQRDCKCSSEQQP